MKAWQTFSYSRKPYYVKPSESEINFSITKAINKINS